MNRRMLLTAALAVAVLTATVLLPGVDPLGVARLDAAPSGSMLGVPIYNGASMNGMTFYTVFNVQNLELSNQVIDVSYYDRNGVIVAKDGATLPSGGNLFLDPNTDSRLPAGFLGSAVISGDGDLAAVANATDRPGGEGVGAAFFDSGRRSLFGPVNNTSMVITSTFVVQNTGPSETFVDLYFTSPQGKQSPDFSRHDLAPGQMLALPVTDVFPTSSVITATIPVDVGTITLFSGGSPAPRPSELRPVSATDFPAVRPSTFSGEGEGTEIYIPSTNAGNGAGGFRGSCDVQNLDSDPATVTVTSYTNRGGNPMGVITQTIPAFGTGSYDDFGGSATLSSGGPIAAVCTRTLGRSNRAARPAGSVVHGLAAVSDTTHRKAVAFGAVSSRTSRAWVGIYNPGRKRGKAKIVVRRGSDGKKLFARTLKVNGHGTAFLKYKRRAFGTDTYAEIKVRGRQDLVAYLVREDKKSGDVTHYPAIPVR